MEQNKELAQSVQNCTKCRLANPPIRRTNAVPALPGVEYKERGLAIFAEAPGRDENTTGRPMVGRAGKLLDNLLTASGLSRGGVLVINRVRCQPPRNRLQDYPDALLGCDEWTRKELEYYNPSVVILAGNTSMRAVFGVTANITAVRGTVRITSDKFQYGARVWIPCFHPAAVLRNPALTQDVISDITLAKSFL